MVLTSQFKILHLGVEDILLQVPLAAHLAPRHDVAPLAQRVLVRRNFYQHVGSDYLHSHTAGL